MKTESSSTDTALLREVAQFIHARWDETVRHVPADDGTLIGLPFPYTVPCARETFQELYYWDTYFTCLGLVYSGRKELVVGNARNFLFLLGRYGFVPNGNRTYYLSRSQPPYLAPLLRLLRSAGGDQRVDAEARGALLREYEFWTTLRGTPTGLSRHGNHASRAELVEFYEAIAVRAQLPPGSEEENIERASHTLSECESGWDFNPRFARRCEDFCPVDLNANLYVYEIELAGLASAAESDMWLQRAARRAERMTELCWDKERGAFFDYDFRHRRRSAVLAASAFQPMWAGLATPAQAERLAREALPRLEAACGVAACEANSSDRVCQWDHPNGWACLQHLVYRGLARYGYADDARRVASKYLAVVSREFQRTGDLWEKYNVEPGLGANKEEEGWVSPEMMGWTAGVYLDALSLVHPGMEAPSN